MTRQIPSSFIVPPGEEPIKYFRNLCIHFKKIILSTQDLKFLQEEMQTLLNAAKQLSWKHETDAHSKKDSAEKALVKVWTEFDRYFLEIQNNKKTANPQDLLEALSEVERMTHLPKAM